MKKLTFYIFLSFFFNNIGFADYGGWIDMVVNSKEHKYCGDLARSMTSNKFKQTDIYYECRTEIDIQQDIEKWKKKDK